MPETDGCLVAEYANLAHMSIKLGRYRHYKGPEYRVICLAKHTETKEDLVIYMDLNDNKPSKFWVRPLAMFVEDVEANGQTMLRFEYLGE